MNILKGSNKFYSYVKKENVKFFILPAFKRKTTELLSLIAPLYMLRVKCYLYVSIIFLMMILLLRIINRNDQVTAFSFFRHISSSEKLELLAFLLTTFCNKWSPFK